MARICAESAPAGLPDGTVTEGEVDAAGPGMMKGYFRDPAATRPP